MSEEKNENDTKIKPGDNGKIKTAMNLLKVKLDVFIGENNQRLNHYQKAILQSYKMEVRTLTEWGELLEKLLPSARLKHPRAKKKIAQERDKKIAEALKKSIIKKEKEEKKAKLKNR